MKDNNPRFCVRERLDKIWRILENVGPGYIEWPSYHRDKEGAVKELTREVGNVAYIVDPYVSEITSSQKKA
jgi:hypothetical protein